LPRLIRLAATFKMQAYRIAREGRANLNEWSDRGLR
jgi:hypothetical protein